MQLLVDRLFHGFVMVTSIKVKKVFKKPSTVLFSRYWQNKLVESTVCLKSETIGYFFLSLFIDDRELGDLSNLVEDANGNVEMNFTNGFLLINIITGREIAVFYFY